MASETSSERADMKPCLRFAWIFAFLVVGPATGADYDLVIRGGKVVDGTGNPWFHGDLAIRGDKIVAVGRIPAGAAGREIDARGLVVAPGFIDMHSGSRRGRGPIHACQEKSGRPLGRPL